MTRGRGPLLTVCAALVLAGPALGAGAPAAGAAPIWRSAAPTPAGSSFPVGLGRIGDIEFYAPNRGLLITDGNEPTVAKGLWAYNGVEWHPLAIVCGASDGRIAWAGPEEFWTVSDGRPGQASEAAGSIYERTAPLEDNTLCHFANGQVVASYAHPAFEADSYLPMHAAACIDSSDCWFAGDPLAEPQIGAFQLKWNGGAIEAEPYPGEGHEVAAMSVLGGRIYASMRIASGDRVAIAKARPPVVYRINPPGSAQTFVPEDEGGEGLPLYAPSELARSLSALRLSVADNVLWGAAGPSGEQVEPEHAPGQVTVVVRERGLWRQLIGPEHPLGHIFPPERLAEEAQFPRVEEADGSMSAPEARNANVTAIAAEPGTSSAWIALSATNPPAGSHAVLIRVSSEGQLLEEKTLPSTSEEAEGIGPKGAAAKLSCPAPGDCWMATTQGWLFHLAGEGEATLAQDTDPNFLGPITYRPHDLGLPQLPPDAPPPDDSGLVEEAAIPVGKFEETKGPAEAKVQLPLLSHVKSRLVKGTTLELRFRLAVQARVRLLAKRRGRLVAATAVHTFKAGTRKLLLRLDRRRWPTKLSLQTHALAPLPLVSSVTGEGANVSTEETRLAVLPRSLLQDASGLLP